MTSKNIFYYHPHAFFYIFAISKSMEKLWNAGEEEKLDKQRKVEEIIKKG